MLDHLYASLLVPLFAVLLLIIPVTKHVVERYVLALRQHTLPELSVPVRVALFICITGIFLAIYLGTMAPSQKGYHFGGSNLFAVIYSYGGFLAALAAPIMTYKGCNALAKALVCEEAEVKN